MHNVCDYVEGENSEDEEVEPGIKAGVVGEILLFHIFHSLRTASQRIKVTAVRVAPGGPECEV